MVFKNLLVKSKDTIRKIDELLDIPTMEKSKEGKILTTVFQVNDEFYNDIDSLRYYQITTQQTYCLAPV